MLLPARGPPRRFPWCCSARRPRTRHAPPLAGFSALRLDSTASGAGCINRTTSSLLASSAPPSPRLNPWRSTAPRGRGRAWMDVQPSTPDPPGPTVVPGGTTRYSTSGPATATWVMRQGRWRGQAPQGGGAPPCWHASVTPSVATELHSEPECSSWGPAAGVPVSVQLPPCLLDGSAGAARGINGHEARCLGIVRRLSSLRTRLAPDVLHLSPVVEQITRGQGPLSHGVERADGATTELPQANHALFHRLAKQPCFYPLTSFVHVHG